MNLYPSLISAPLLFLNQTIKELEPYCAGFHLDVMDFHFVPNLTWGPAFINAIRKATNKQLWIHLMAEKPQALINAFKLRNNDIISVHYESVSVDELKQLFISLKEQKLQTSLAIKPSTPIRETVRLFPYLDQCLIMSVEPGFSGQPFLVKTYERLKELHALCTEYRASFRIALDGGVTPEIAKNLAAYDIHDIAVADALFGKGKDAVTAAKTFFTQS